MRFSNVDSKPYIPRLRSLHIYRWFDPLRKRLAILQKAAAEEKRLADCKWAGSQKITRPPARVEFSY
jgi:hypothetical protein